MRIVNKWEATPVTVRAVLVKSAVGRVEVVFLILNILVMIRIAAAAIPELYMASSISWFCQDVDVRSLRNWQRLII